MKSLRLILLHIPLLRELVIDQMVSEIEELLNADFHQAAQLACVVWKTSRGVFGQLYINHYSAMKFVPEFRLIQGVIHQGGEESLSFFNSLLHSESAQLTAYAILGLANYDEGNALHHLSSSLRQDERKILLLSTIREEITLKELIARLEKYIV